MDKKTKVKRVETYGTCVWATGIAPVPLTKDIAKKIPGQTNRLLKAIYFLKLEGVLSALG